MTGKVVSIEIGRQVIKICEIEYKKKNPHVYRCISFETPMEFVNDGHINNQEALAECLLEKMKDAGIKNDKVVFTISSTKIANREVVIPDVKENRIMDVVMAGANDYFPIDIEEYTISYTILEKIAGEENKQIRLLVLAAPESMIKGYYELADWMKVEIVSIDYIGNSAYQILRNLEYSGINLAVQMNEQNTIISIVENDSLLLQRTLPYGMSTLIQSVISTEVFGVENSKEVIELLNRQPIIKAQFVDMKTDYRSFTEETEEQVRLRMREEAEEEVTNSLRLLLSNMNRVIDYFVTQHYGKRIERIVVTGDGIYVKNIENLIANELGIATEVLSELPNVSFVKEASGQKEEQNHYLSCIGAAIAPVGFTPKELAKRDFAKSPLRFPLFILMLCALGSIIIVLSSVILYRQAKREYNELEQKISDIGDISSIYADYKESKDRVDALKDVDAHTANSSEHILDFLEELEQKMPKGCMINAMQYGEKTLTLQIKANDKTLCAKFIEIVKTVEQVESVTTNGYIADDQAQKDGPVTSTIVCTLK